MFDFKKIEETVEFIKNNYNVLPREELRAEIKKKLLFFYIQKNLTDQKIDFFITVVKENETVETIILADILFSNLKKKEANILPSDTRRLTSANVEKTVPKVKKFLELLKSIGDVRFLPEEGTVIKENEVCSQKASKDLFKERRELFLSSLTLFENSFLSSYLLVFEKRIEKKVLNERKEGRVVLVKKETPVLEPRQNHRF
ncbi:hypothetical protein J6590_085955 [Homalodisca vitripennis]|nr:hypothetical protein J6590_085955 [Homalodisca vitripennis]